MENSCRTSHGRFTIGHPPHRLASEGNYLVLPRSISSSPSVHLVNIVDRVLNLPQSSLRQTNDPALSLPIPFFLPLIRLYRMIASRNNQTLCVNLLAAQSRHPHIRKAIAIPAAPFLSLERTWPYCVQIWLSHAPLLLRPRSPRLHHQKRLGALGRYWK